MVKRILSVGQCDHDHGLLTNFAKQCTPPGQEVELVRSATAEQALSTLRSDSVDLIWVNRMFDADNSFGIELIKALRADPLLSRIPAMLVSNFSDAQREAQANGAMQGFGKDSLKDPATIERIRNVLASEDARL